MPKKVIVVRKQPASGPKRSCLGNLIAAAALLISGIYILNPTAGVDLLPDNLPLAGNLDEAFFTVVLLSSLAYFGLEIPFLSRRFGVNAQRPQPQGAPKPTEGEDKPV